MIALRLHHDINMGSALGILWRRKNNYHV